MYPWGWECNDDAPTKNELQRVADITANAIYKVHGVKFQTGGICKTIYQASGSSIDWAYEKGGVQYPFAVELRDTGRYGFMLPANQIVPSGEEMTASIVAMVSAI